MKRLSLQFLVAFLLVVTTSIATANDPLPSWNDGATVLTDTFFPSERLERIEIYSRNTPTIVTEAEISHLGSIWK